MILELLVKYKWIISPIIYQVMVISIILTLYHYWMIQTRDYRIGSKIPGPKPLPILGNCLLALDKKPTEIIDYAIELSKIYGDIGRIFVGYKPVVFLSNPDDVELILNSNIHLDKSIEYRFFKPWLGDGLLISSGEKWRRHRKLIAPAFHQNVLKTFIPIFNRNSLKVVKSMSKENGRMFDVHDYMSEITVDILLETAMGHPRTHADKEGYDYAMAVMKLCDIFHTRHRKFYYCYDAIFNLTKYKKQQDKLISIIHGLTGRVFQSKKQKFYKDMEEGNVPSPTFAEVISNEENTDDIVPETEIKKDIFNLQDDLDEQDKNDVGQKRRLAFLDLMIESAYHGAQLDDAEIKEEVDTIMFEGHDTTAAGSSFALSLLAIYSKIQDKVYDEQKAIFGTSTRPATFADTLEMKYLERVILETIRLYPPVPVIARRLADDVKLVSKDLTIPAGSTVVIATFKIHRRDQTYENPNIFDPDNFLPDKTQNRPYYSYIPFSAGPRSCVGRKYAMLKLKILLSTIVRNFEIRSNVPEKDYQLTADIILKRADGFRMQLLPRKIL